MIRLHRTKSRYFAEMYVGEVKSSAYGAMDIGNERILREVEEFIYSESMRGGRYRGIDTQPIIVIVNHVNTYHGLMSASCLASMHHEPEEKKSPVFTLNEEKNNELLLLI